MNNLEGLNSEVRLDPLSTLYLFDHGYLLPWGGGAYGLV